MSRTVKSPRRSDLSLRLHRVLSSAELDCECRTKLDQALDRFSELCRALGESETTVALAWVLHQPAVTSAIVGVRTVAHLEGLDRAAALKLDAEALKRLDEVFDINKGRPLRIAPAPEAYAW